MPSDTLPQRLLDVLRATQARESELLALCDDSPALRPDRWTAKDHVAHLSWWRNHAAETVRAARLGQPVERITDIDANNERTYSANRDRRADDVRADAIASYEHLAQEITRSSDEDLRRPRPDRRELEAWQVVPPNLEGHLAEHLSQWYLEHGADDAAENAQQWVMQLDDESLDEPRQRAAGLYNIACYYAKHGREAEAVARLREAIELYPMLARFAREDTDLDSIRDRDELRELITAG